MLRREMVRNVYVAKLLSQKWGMTKRCGVTFIEF